MNLIILYSEKDKITLDEYYEFFNKLNIDIVILKITNSWENDSEFFNYIKKNNYFLILTNNESFQEKWFKFIVGYCLGKSCSLYLKFDNLDFKIPDNLSFMHYGFNFKMLEEFYKNEYQVFLKNEELKNIKEKIINKKMEFTLYYFFNSIEKDDTEGIELFLRAGFSPDAKNEKGIYAFNYAVRLSHNDIAKKLMDYNCNIFNVSADNGNNSLMDAAAENNIEMVKILIENGIDINVKSKNEQTALMLASGRNNEEIVDILLSHNADPYIKDVLDMTAIKYAEILKYKNILKLFNKYKIV